MNTGLDEIFIQRCCNVFSKFANIEKVILFGSRALGTFKTGSDIDLCLYGKNLSLSELFQVQLELDNLEYPYTFDVILFSHLLANRDSNTKIILHIENFGMEIYCKL